MAEKQKSNIELKKLNDYSWEIPKTGKMNVPCVIFASERLLEKMKEDDTFKQAMNVATLPELVKNIIVLPDGHMGYGMPIGGVMACRADTGFISPGSVGFDINCGVRMLSTNIPTAEFLKKRKEILHAIFRSVPSGVGHGGKAYSREEILEVLKEGAEWAVKHKMGNKDDLKHCEENGKMSPANPEDVSQRAISRGLPQLGTLGSGNHFLEIQKVDKIYDKELAQKFGISKENITIMIHCGSRGLGHQVASDYIMLMEKEFRDKIKELPDRELINAPIKSELGQKYLSAMNCAVNFAFCNRQMIMHHVREQIKHYFPKSDIKLIYDVCHNIAKIEEHIVDGKKMKLCLHRKGATRSFEGLPVLIPGSMGTASYILVGTKKAEELTFGSTAHGAGRVESRTQAKRELTAEGVKKELDDKDIIIEAGSMKGLVEEAPEVYKDVDEVVRVSNEAGIGKIVARVVPLAVMKG